MRLDKVADHREPNSETATLKRNSTLILNEELENVRQSIWRNADAIVGNLDHDRAGFCFCSQRDGAARWRVLRCVVEQITDNLREPQMISFHAEWL